MICSKMYRLTGKVSLVNSSPSRPGISERGVMAARMLWEHVARVRISALRQDFGRKYGTKEYLGLEGINIYEAEY